MATQSGRVTHPTRRETLRVLAVGGALVGGALGGGALGGAWALGAPSGIAPAGLARRTRVLMGTSVDLTVVGEDPDDAAGAAEAALEQMAATEGLLTRYRPGSEVWRLNETGRVDDPSHALLDVLRLADRVWRLGDGAFDVSVQPVLDLYQRQLAADAKLPTATALEEAVGRVDHRALQISERGVTSTRPELRITLDGIGKGYVVDQGVAVLRRRGFANVLVEAGGDLVAAGQRNARAPWRIGIRRPRRGLLLQTRFATRNRAVATSGDYMQPFSRDYTQHHIVDPRSGYSSPELASATVVAADAATADALATLVMVLGPRKGRTLIEDLPECEGYFLGKDLRVTRTSGFDSA